MKRKLGTQMTEQGEVFFTVWAPLAEDMEVVFKEKTAPISLTKDDKGYWQGSASGLQEGALYKFRLDDGKELPDPASRSQPEGVHGWSAVVDVNKFKWNDTSWKGIPTSEMIIYELHVGTFTTDGTFSAIIDKLDHLRELGINTIEIMPVSSFPGDRNWGYDGVYPYATQESYGGASGLQKLVDVCHEKDMAVLMDVVYNHMGPEGNYLSQFGPYFTDAYKTPWGEALNFNEAYSYGVRDYFIGNALMWLRDFHIDGLRLDAVHAIIDGGATHFLKELRQAVDALEKETKRNYILIAESDLNDVKLVKPSDQGGYGLNGQWVDDFHHAVHTLLTHENNGYYTDFGTLDAFAKAFTQGFVYDGIFSEFRKRYVGNSPVGIDPSKFVVCIQNHDQVGNRVLGNRLSTILSFEKQKLAAGILFISPYVPMLFMGEEFGEDNPFQFFVSHTDPDLIKAVRKGRKEEFEYFLNHDDEFPDPQDEKTFLNSKLNWDFRQNKQKRILFEYYKTLISLRKSGTFSSFRKAKAETFPENGLVTLTTSDRLAVLNFNDGNRSVRIPEGVDIKEVVFASAEKRWGGPMDDNSHYRSDDHLEVPKESIVVFSIKN